MIRVMILEPGEHAEVRRICPREVGRLVDGQPEISQLKNGIAVAVNKDGKIKGMPLNRAIKDAHGNILDIFAGTMVFFGCSRDRRLMSITDEQVIHLLEEFGRPQSPEDWLEDEDVPFNKAEAYALLRERLKKKYPDAVIRRNANVR